MGFFLLLLVFCLFVCLFFGEILKVVTEKLDEIRIIA